MDGEMGMGMGGDEVGQELAVAASIFSAVFLFFFSSEWLCCTASDLHSDTSFDEVKWACFTKLSDGWEL
jgi:hypothetical protein